MKVLILGGTGAIGSYLVNILSENHIDTTVTTRRFHDNISYVTYVCGNAHDNDFLTYIIHSGFISGYQNRYGDNLKPPTNVYHRMTA